MINILLIGNGKWAQNYISTLSEYKNVNLKIATRNNWEQLINEMPDGVIVCTPPDSHIRIAEHSLNKNIPTLIEKPLALSLNAANSLKQFKSPILVNHIHLFSEAYQNLKRLIDKNKITSIMSLGFNKGPIRDYSSLWDYGCHDISMILDLLEDLPNEILTTELQTDTGSLFNVKLKFNTLTTESLIGNGGGKKVRKLKVNLGGLRLTYDDNDRLSFHKPPLTNAINVFIDMINGKQDNRCGLDLSFKIIKVLEYCEKSINAKSSVYR